MMHKKYILKIFALLMILEKKRKEKMPYKDKFITRIHIFIKLHNKLFENNYI